MNLYMYVEGNPVMYRDPSGHKRLFKTWNMKKLVNKAVMKIGANIKALGKGLSQGLRGLGGLGSMLYN
jgi:hypothetical protein